MGKNKREKDYNNLYDTFNAIGNLVMCFSLIIGLVFILISFIPTAEERLAKKEKEELLKEQTRLELLKQEEEKIKKQEEQEREEYKLNLKLMNSTINDTEALYREELNNGNLTLQMNKEFKKVKVEVYTHNKDNTIIYRVYNDDFDKLISFHKTDYNENLIGINEATDDLIKITDVLVGKTIVVKLVDNTAEIIASSNVEVKGLLTEEIMDFNIMNKEVNKDLSDIITSDKLSHNNSERIMQLVLKGETKYREIITDIKLRQDLTLLTQQSFKTLSTSILFNSKDNELIIAIKGKIKDLEVDRIIAYSFLPENKNTSFNIGMNGSIFIINDIKNRGTISIDLNNDKEPISININDNNNYEYINSLL